MAKKDNKETLLFTFVPTMRCNYRCAYCFLSDEEKYGQGTIFDEHPVEQWIDGMEKFSSYNIEPYFWGGEPFCIDETYYLLREWVKMDHVIGDFRIDTNVHFADKIAEMCPSSKIKLNCSFHMQYTSLEEEFRKIKLLKDLDMVAMVNFVASEYNLTHLMNDYGMTVIDLIDKFAEIDVFVNIAGDFAYANDLNYGRYDEYQAFIQQFISPDEWKWLRGVRKKCVCDAGKRFFRVRDNGDLVSCIDGYKTVYGNFLDGKIELDKANETCDGRCKSIISYCFRKDNTYSPINSLMEYVKRNKEYRENYKDDFRDFLF